MRNGILKKNKGISLILRLVLVAIMVTCTLGFIVQPAFAASTITQLINPCPINYRLNTGGYSELMWWKIEGYTHTPNLVRHIITDPTGTIVHQDDFPIAGGSPGNPPVVYNTEDPTGAYFGDGNPDYAHKWEVPAGAIPGDYLSSVYFFSTEVLAGQQPSPPPLGHNTWEKESTQTFWVRQPLTVFNYNDLNGDGTFEPGEPGLDNWQFSISGPDGYSFSGSTAGGGYLDLPPIRKAGDYTITETPQAGWRNTDPGVSSPYQKIIAVPDDLSPTDPIVFFGNNQLSNLEIFTYLDLDSDGNYDPGETPLANWQFNVAGPDGFNGTFSTDLSGVITITGLQPDLYTATEVLQAGWTNTDPGGAEPYSKAITISAGGSAQVNFGNNQLGQLTIFKYNDQDMDGTWDTGEEGLPGWDFIITGLPDTYTTDANGMIDIFTNAGDYTVTEAVQTGWSNITPNPRMATVTAGDTTTIEFGNYAAPTETGVNVPVSLSSFVSATFSEVVTPGISGVTTSDSGPTLPMGFQLGDPPIYYDITSTATFVGSVQISIKYDPSQFTSPENELILLHWENSAPVNVTVSVDTVNHIIYGEVTSFSDFVIAQPSTYTIMASAGANGRILPSGQVTVKGGKKQTFVIIPDRHYHIDDVIVDGISLGPVHKYTFRKVNANHTIEASFVISAHTIIASAGDHGTISPSGSVIVDDGDKQTFIITPDAHYYIADVKVDGVSVGAINKYTFRGVTRDHTIAASFIPAFIITASAGPNGWIAPSGSVEVPKGDNQTFRIIAAPGYHIATVLVDGVSVGAVSKYTFHKVNASHSIAATFKVTYDSLRNLVCEYVTKHGIVKSLMSKLDAAEAADLKGNAEAKAGLIGAFINEVEAQSGKALSVEHAHLLIALAKAL